MSSTQTARTSTDSSKKQDRSPRAAESREAEARSMEWVQPDILPMPEAVEGWVFRYIRVSTHGQEDNRNVSIRFREGWEPVKAEDYPELQVMSDHNSYWGNKGGVEIGGLLLCKAPSELMESRAQKHRDMANQQIDAIDNNLMKEEDPRVPIFRDRKTKVSFGSG